MEAFYCELTVIEKTLCGMDNQLSNFKWLPCIDSEYKSYIVRGKLPVHDCGEKKAM